MKGRTVVPALGGTPRVNLMPRVEVERREASALVRRWLFAVCAAVALVAVVCAGAFALRWAAEQRVAMAEARTATLLGELAALAEVSTAVRTVAALEAFREDAMAADLEWSPLLDRFDTLLPEGVVIGGFDVTTGGVPAEDAATGIGLSGTLTVYSATPMEMAPVIRSFRDIAGVQFLDGREVLSEPVQGASFVPRLYEYILVLDLDQSVYSGEHAGGQE